MSGVGVGAGVGETVGTAEGSGVGVVVGVVVGVGVGVGAVYAIASQSPLCSVYVLPATMPIVSMLVKVPVVTTGAVQVVFPTVLDIVGPGVGVAGGAEGLGEGVADAGGDEPSGVALGVAGPDLTGATGLLEVFVHPTAAATAASTMTQDPLTRMLTTQPNRKKRANKALAPTDSRAARSVRGL